MTVAQVPTASEIQREPNQNRKDIMGAIQRIVAGQPRHIEPGDHRIVSLAKEAGVDRQRLYKEHSDLRDRFVFLVEHADQPTAQESELLDQIAALRSRLAEQERIKSDSNESRDKWKAMATALSHAVATLQAELRAERERSARLSRRLDEAGANVVSSQDDRGARVITMRTRVKAETQLT